MWSEEHAFNDDGIEFLLKSVYKILKLPIKLLNFRQYFLFLLVFTFIYTVTYLYLLFILLFINTPYKLWKHLMFP